MPVRFDVAGNASAPLDDFEGAKTIMREWCSVDPDGIEFTANYGPDAVPQLREQLEFHSLPVSFQHLSWVFGILRDSGQLLTSAQVEAAKQAEQEASVPRDKNGRQVLPTSGWKHSMALKFSMFEPRKVL